MNREQVSKLENDLSVYLRKRRIIFGILFIAFLIIGIACASIRELTKEVAVHGSGIFSYQTVKYNDYYIIGILIGFLTATVSGGILVSDIISCRFKTVETNNHYITVYKGMNKCSVYINGEEKEKIGLFALTNVVDAKLPDGTKISVAFSKSAFMIAHISFSDNNAPIDV